MVWDVPGLSSNCQSIVSEMSWGVWSGQAVLQQSEFS
jgi:hypothetical protein